MRELRLVGRLTAVLLSGTCLSPLVAEAQTWLSNPGSGDFNTGSNWSGGTAPSGAGATAIFGSSGTTSIGFSADTTVGALQFGAGAPGYTFGIGAGRTVQLQGAGIQNGSANAPQFNVNGGLLIFGGSASAGNATLTTSGANGQVNFTGTSSGGAARLVANGTTASGGFDFSGLTSAGTSVGSIEGSGRFVLGGKQLTVGGNNLSTEVSGTISGVGGSLVKTGTGTLTLSGANTYSGVSTLVGTTTLTLGTTISGGAINISNASALGSGAAVMAGGTLRSTANLAVANTLASGPGSTGTIAAAAGTTLTMTGTWYVLGNSTMVIGSATDTGTVVVAGGIGASLPATNSLVVAGGTLRDGTAAGRLGSQTGQIASVTVNSGATIDFGNVSAVGPLATQIRKLFGSGTIATGTDATKTLRIFEGDFSGSIVGARSLTKLNPGTLILTGTNTYTGGTIVSGGTLQGNSTSLQGNITNDAAVVFDQWGTGTYAGVMSGSGTLTKQGAGTLTLSGTNTYTGATTVNAGGLVVNGSLARGVTVNDGFLGGTGTVGGLTVNAGGTLAPGNSIGTLTVAGNYVHNAGGAYQVEINAAGQSDRTNVTGTATLNGGTVQVVAAPGAYAASTTYTIVNATGGVTGAYGSAATNLAFLTPTLSYDLNNVYLNVKASFTGGGTTPNEREVGRVLDQAAPTATGDLNAIIGAMLGLDTNLGPLALTTISGQPYASFGTLNVQSGRLFMNTVGQQQAAARGAADGATRVALAEACEAACDTAEPARWGAWFSGMGTTGSVGGTANSATLSYTMGGAAVGVDYRLDPRFLVGLATGFSSGRQWVGGFQGTGSTDNYDVALYASFTQGAFYADALAGYAYSDNQLQRIISIPGIPSRTASGRTGANQFIGQLEAGYKVGIYEPAQASITPFVRLQTVAISQNGFGENGANALNLNVAQQNTTSVRTVIGADLGGGIPVGTVKLGTTVRLGWAHEFAEIARPMTAAFAGAPAIPFTIYGAQPQRDAAVIGLGLNTAIADATSLYVRYDGEITGRDDAHVFSAGLRMTW